MTLGMGFTLSEPRLSQEGPARWRLLCSGPPWGPSVWGELPPSSARRAVARPWPGSVTLLCVDRAWPVRN